MDRRCYQPYYGMWIEPVGQGKVMVSTCCNNVFLKANRLMIRDHFKESWNALLFRRQREYISKNDWRFCDGAHCSPTPRQIQERVFKDPRVGQSIAHGRTYLDYPPQEIFIFPSFSCNNDCFCCYCKQKMRCGTRNEYALTAEQSEEIKRDLFPGARSIVISGGEPFYSIEGKNMIDAALAVAPEARVDVFTNGTLLHTYGLDRVIAASLGLRISFYGMSERVYKDVTGTDGFMKMMGNVDYLLRQGYSNMRFLYLLSKRSDKDVRKFCSFVSKHKGIEGVVRNNISEGGRYRHLMLSLAEEFASDLPRLSFEYRSETAFYKMFRKVISPWFSFRYASRNDLQT